MFWNLQVSHLVDLWLHFLAWSYQCVVYGHLSSKYRVPPVLMRMFVNLLYQCDRCWISGTARSQDGVFSPCQLSAIALYLQVEVVHWSGEYLLYYQLLRQVHECWNLVPVESFICLVVIPVVTTRESIGNQMPKRLDRVTEVCHIWCPTLAALWILG